MPEIVKKKRIFQIAKEFNISHDEIINFLSKFGIEHVSVNSPVEMDIYDKIFIEFSKDKEALDRFRKDQARKNIQNTIRSKDADDTKIKPDQTEAPTPKKAAPDIREKMVSLGDKLLKEKQRLQEAKKKEIIPVEIPIDPVIESEVTVKDEVIGLTKTVKKSTGGRSIGLTIISKPDPIAIAEAARLKEEKKKALEQKKATQPSNAPGLVPPKAPEKIKKSKDKLTTLKKFNVRDIAEKLNQSKRTRPPKEKSASLTISGLKTKSTTQIGGKSDKRKTSKVVKKTSEIASHDEEKKIISIPEFSTVDELARSMNVNATDVIKTCMTLGMMASINFRLDMESIQLIADEYKFEIEADSGVGNEIVEKIQSNEVNDQELLPRPPVVTIMGHVDHGKTSLLDYIRKGNVVAGESGGITQHIGAYEVILDTGEKITFIDTPGHAAFTAMRSRGAQVTDIVVIIIAADDAVMPQTKEAIDHAKAAGVPIIIAINKIDLPNSDTEKVIRELSEQNILVENWGGKYQCALISAKSGEGIKELLDKILIESEMLELKAPRDTFASGVVIESRLDRGLGAVATILIQSGTLKKGDVFVCGPQYARVRAILDERNNRLEIANPSDPVQILGFSEVPNAGDKFFVLEDEREARRIALQRSQLQREAEHRRFRHLTLEQIGKRISEGEIKNLDIIIKGDVDGSIEAISDALMGLSTSEVVVNIMHRSVGMITESDVSLANASNAIIIAFNVMATPEARLSAKLEKIDIRHYSVIYDAVNEIKMALEGLLTPDRVEEILGSVEVRALFKIGRKNAIAGCYVRSGKVVKGSLLRLIREKEVVFAGRLSNLKRFKENVNEVKEGYECGISMDNFSNFIEGDTIEFYEFKEVKRKLS
ncbi:MAG: translation initiation factor IF-2 [Candidatus Marinimicrobia bacterium]|nr:translation initiation factor IF-2 [Candidatus Neomarinimicrobiota bacterium]